MKMKIVSKSRWTILALVVVGLIVLFNITGCAMFEKQMTTMKGLVGLGDKDVIVCEGTECVETPVAIEEVKG